MARTTNTVPARPFADWLNAREQRYTGREEMAARFGVATRTLHRYMACKMETKENGEYVVREAEHFDRNTVDEMLRNAGFWLWDVYSTDEYPELYRTDLLPPVIYLDPALVVEAKALYDTGLGMCEIAKALLAESRYSSWESLSMSLYREFRNQGWQTRSRGEASSLSQRPGVCAGMVAGRRCTRHPLRDSEYCFNHDPNTAHLSRAHLSRGPQVRREQGLELAPFAVWIRDRREECGSYLALSKRIGVHNTQLWRWGHETRRTDNGEIVPLQWVERRSVERVLEAWGDGTTVDDLYLKVAA